MMKILNKNEKKKIKELNTVKLKKDLPEFNLKKGQRGIVALIYSSKEIEVALREKDTGRLIQLPVNLVE